ncbi:enoyl-CoA hydratase/isomerase family protein [Phaeacidiphilus oryzae]|uniref:enoyl-CoA hydratase/isomerase family protein n=1 Tax=Phaeacidiphilus oryzae TaxID=348818 RepID=UPI000563FFAE|nr:enoyl-CoA hydratase-related protein [Phaeacidiphilus oryzae]
MTSSHLRLDVSGPVATITIDRPAKRNAMSLEMWGAIPALVKEVESDPAVRVLVLRGNEHFSAGADISEFQTHRQGAEGARNYSAVVHAAERALAELALPSLAAVRGFCIGGGCELALACDLRIAAADARFGITPAKLGIVYHYSSTKQLVDAVGPAWARQILYSGEQLDAATALRIGLVNEVHEVADGAFDRRVDELAETIAARAPVSVRGTKAITRRILDQGAAGADAPEVEALYQASYTSREYAEGVQAFLDKRPPRFAP